MNYSTEAFSGMNAVSFLMQNYPAESNKVKIKSGQSGINLHKGYSKSDHTFE